MKRIVIFLLFSISIFQTRLKAQLLLPEFGDAVKQELFSSENEESSPVPFNNGNGLYYNRTYITGTGDQIEVTGHDFWISKIGKKGWQKPYRVFRSEEIEGENILIGTCQDGNRIYLLSATFENEVITQKIVYLDNKGKNKWTDPVEIVVPGFTIKENYLHFYINPKETAILVSKPSPNNKNLQEDIFISLKDTITQKWSALIDLGSKINTSRNELASFISQDLRKLYFSSEGHGGYGSADIFVSYRLSDDYTDWTTPMNLGEPINSKDYDAGFIMANNKEVYFVSDRNSGQNNIYKSVATGGTIIANADSVLGRFYYKGLPVDNIRIIIQDEDGNVVDELVTGAYGEFKFSKLKAYEEGLLIRLAEEDDELYVGSKIYFVNNQGQKTKRYVFTEEGFFVNTRDLSEETAYQGMFTYNALPAMNSALVIMDENGFPLDTIFTDEKGKFNYSLLKYDNGFSIVPLNMTEDEFKNVELFLVDKNGNNIHSLVPGEYKRLTKSMEAQAKNQNTTAPHIIDKEKLNGSELEISAWNGMAQKSREVYFGLNKKTASVSELSKLSTLISILQYDKAIKIKLVGHTDSKGSNELNMTIGSQRAKAIKRYLVSKGISASRILTESKGEENPFYSNETEEGKAQNRRVEVKIQ